MWSVNRVCFVSFGVFALQSLLACGGSTVDSHGNPDTGDDTGDTGDNSRGGRSGSGDGSAGKGAGSAGKGAGSAGASSSGPDGTKLSAIKTDAQALAVCERIRESIADQDLSDMRAGSCAIQGLTGEAQQLGTCQELQASCAAHTPLPDPNDGSCTASDIPDCDNVTVDEYVACMHGTIALGVAYLSKITCDTDLTSLEQPGTAAACQAPFARCPEYAALYQ